jgi:hypothetical protein
MWKEVTSQFEPSCRHLPRLTDRNQETLHRMIYCPSLYSELQLKLKLNALTTVIRPPVCLGVSRSSGTRDQFFLLLEISFRQLWVCYFVAPYLTRGRVCNLRYNCFWALPEQSLLVQSPAELTAIFYCLIWESPRLEGQVPVFISLRKRVAQLYTQALGSLFVASSVSQGLRSRYSNPPLHREEWDLSTISYIKIQFVPHRNHITSF